jgi:N-acetylmuramic acid 6-phosphate (MurNAc-6-P) etherase
VADVRRAAREAQKLIRRAAAILERAAGDRQEHAEALQKLADRTMEFFTVRDASAMAFREAEALAGAVLALTETGNDLADKF